MNDLGLAIAASGLNADTAELDTASNNLSNIDTPGYAAEQVNLSPEAAAGPLGAGQGVIVGSVTQLTDAVYAAASVAAVGVQGAATQTNQIMSSIEAIFPEPDTSGISAQLSTLFSDLSTLASNPGQAGAEQVVVGAAQSLATTFNISDDQLDQLASSLQSQIGSGADDGGTLSQVNSLLAQVAQLNQGIVAGSAGGQDANALSDEASSAVSQLAGLLGITSSTAADGAVTVDLNGVQLVGGDVAQTLTTSGSAATADLGLVTSNGVAVDATGSIGASLTAINTTIPDYETQLSSVADSLATSLNTLQANGLDASGGAGSDVPGSSPGTALPNIFVNEGSSTTYTPGRGSAATIAVSPALLADPSLIATASAPGTGNSNVVGTPTLDGTNAQAMASIATSSSGPEVLYQTMIGALGTQASSASTASTTASSLATTAANNLSSISGVNENDEEVAILAAQNAFQASSQVINAMNESFQSLLQAV
jgi:flagellar hook-associated protein 1